MVPKYPRRIVRGIRRHQACAVLMGRFARYRDCGGGELCKVISTMLASEHPYVFRL